MKSYQHILLATDLSIHSEFIAKRAQTIAHLSQARLSVVHVIEHVPTVYGGEYSLPIDTNLEDSLKEKARKNLNNLSKKLAVKLKDQYLIHGSVQQEVIETAENIKADLIIIGTHSHTGLDALLGSRASTILSHAKCDTLVVHIH